MICNNNISIKVGASSGSEVEIKVNKVKTWKAIAKSKKLVKIIFGFC